MIRFALLKSIYHIGVAGMCIAKSISTYVDVDIDMSSPPITVQTNIDEASAVPNGHYNGHFAASVQSVQHCLAGQQFGITSITSGCKCRK